MHHIVCENRATNVGILRQSSREDTWRPLAQPAGRHCQRRTDKNYLRDVSREALGHGDVNAKGRVEAIMVRAGCLSPYRASMIVRGSRQVNRYYALGACRQVVERLRSAQVALHFFDNVHFVLRLYGTHRLSTTEQKEVTRNDEKIVHLASPLPHPQYLP